VRHKRPTRTHQPERRRRAVYVDEQQPLGSATCSQTRSAQTDAGLDLGLYNIWPGAKINEFMPIHCDVAIK
jgi:hypothetical protein